MKHWVEVVKKCGNCFKTKPLDEFYIIKSSNKKDGRQNECKRCRTEICYVYNNFDKPKRLDLYFAKRYSERVENDQT